MMASASQLTMFARRGGRAQAAVDDICRRKHGGNTESAAAFNPTAAMRDRDRVYAFIKARGETGATLDETAEAFNVGLNRISGRFTDLRTEEPPRILRTGDRRPTRTGKLAAVYVAMRA